MTPGAGFADHTAAARRSTDRRAVRWVACLALSSTALTTGGHAARAQGVSAPSAPGSAAPTLTRLTITLAGVSHHEWLAPRDATRVVLPVRLDDVDDMLRSITGVGGTQLLSVSLPGPQDAINAFDALPFQADTLNDPVALLNALRELR